MDTYPEKTCAIDRLIRHPKLVIAAKSGEKTQQRRNGIYAYPGETFKLDAIEFTITAVESQRLAEMTEADAKAEGYPSLETYRAMILKMHSGMQWDDSNHVWIHYFERKISSGSDG